jgi:ferredoxin
VTGCAEGALQIVNGKAKLVNEVFCDGLGACIGECPTGALKIVEREAPAFNPVAVEAHLKRLGREPAGHSHTHTHAAGSKARPPAAHAGCPGSAMRMSAASETPAPVTGTGLPAMVQRSELAQWPVQLHLVQPGAPFFKNRELVLLSTCAPVASADVHWRFLRGRAVAVGCPKLDDTEGYVDKLAAILAEPTIPKVQVVRMEVPCCGGLTMILRQAIELSGRKDLAAEEVVVGTDGAIKSARAI